MNIKRAILTGALLWVLIFFEVSILMFGFKLQVPSTLYYLVHFPLAAILIGLVSYLYFKNQTESGAKNGLVLGAVYLVIGVILDSAITIPLFVKDYSFLIRTEMLVSYLGTVIVTTIIGMLKK